MIAMVKTTQESQIKGKLHMNTLQENPLTLLALSWTNMGKIKQQKEEKVKILEDNNLEMHGKIAILEKQIDKQEQYSRCNCILLHSILEYKREVTDNVPVKTTFENKNVNIITVDDIDISHKIGKQDPQKKTPKTCDREISSI